MIWREEIIFAKHNCFFSLWPHWLRTSFHRMRKRVSKWRGEASLFLNDYFFRDIRRLTIIGGFADDEKPMKGGLSGEKKQDLFYKAETLRIRVSIIKNAFRGLEIKGVSDDIDKRDRRQTGNTRTGDSLLPCCRFRRYRDLG